MQILQHRIPTIRESGYDFIEISSRAHVSVVKKIEKRDFGFESDYTGMYQVLLPPQLLQCSLSAFHQKNPTCSLIELL